MAVTSGLTRYRPLSKIASGGMATITLAEDTVLGRRVALKRLTGTASRDGISRLRREALVGASVSHPNLVSIYDVVAENDDVVIVMEYVDGWTLEDDIAQGRRLPPAEAIRILRGVARALDAIHARGIVHRDVKPPNILLGRHGEVKLADLGIAAAPNRTSITTEGSVLGSFSYMAPEQLEARRATPAMDVYALSAVAFEALSGRRARQENNPMALAHAIATQPPPDLSQAWPQAPVEVTELLQRGMARDPAQRPSSAGELVRNLHAALGPVLEAGGSAAAPVPSRGSRNGGAPSPAAPTGRPAAPARRPAAATGRPSPPSRRPGAAAAAGLAAGAAAGLGARAAARSSAEAATRTSSQRAAEAETQVPRRRAADAAGAAPFPGDGGARTAPDRRPASPPASRNRTSRPRAGWFVPLLLALVAIAVVAAVLSSGGSSHSNASSQNPPARPGAARTKKKPRDHATAHRPAAAAAPAGQSSSSPPAGGSSSGGSSSGAAAAGNHTPVSAVERFYGLAAAHQFASAWALADPAFRSQLEGYNSFVAGQQGDRRIIFKSAQVTSQSAGAATVAVSTTSIRNDGTQQCSGTVDVVPGGGGWLLHQIHITC